MPEGYIITQIDTLRPVFDAVADGYHRYYDPSWEHDEAVAEPLKEMPEQLKVETSGLA